MSARQESHDRIRSRQYEEERPKPKRELYQLQALAREAVTDPSKALEWVTAATPEEFLLALEAREWDKAHPWYSCIECKDGKELPEGYECKECGENNGYEGRY